MTRTTRPLTTEELRSITPKVLPVDPLAQKYGLPPGMAVDTQSATGWRCISCHELQDTPEGVYISDGVGRGDSLAAISENIRQTWWQGHSSKWCIPCVQKLVRVPLSKRVKKPWFLALLFS